MGSAVIKKLIAEDNQDIEVVFVGELWLNAIEVL